MDNTRESKIYEQVYSKNNKRYSTYRASIPKKFADFLCLKNRQTLSIVLDKAYNRVILSIKGKDRISLKEWEKRNTKKDLRKDKKKEKKTIQSNSKIKIEQQINRLKDWEKALKRNIQNDKNTIKTYRKEIERLKKLI